MAKKLFYKIGEACKLLDIQPYVLRYWETEFSHLAPDKSSSGQRVYSEKEIIIIRRLKELLYNEGYTIAGAKKRLDQELPEMFAETTEEPLPPKGRPAARLAAVMQRTRAEAAAEGAANQTALDTATQEKIETLRAGIRRALDDAKSILAQLEAPSGATSSP